MFLRISRGHSPTRLVLVAGGITLVCLLLVLTWAGVVYSEAPVGALGGPYQVSGDAPGDQTMPAIASSGSGFLAAWTDPRTSVHGVGDIYARRIATDGSSVEGPLVIVCDNSQNQKDVDLAYNAATNAYVAVWQDHRNEGYPFVYGQLIHRDGQLIGGNFEVAGPSFKVDPAVACNASYNECLVAWKDPGADFNILARRISGWGSSVGDAIGVCTVTGDQSEPDVASNPDTDAYLVVWRDERGGAGGRIYGQRVSHDGTLLGPDIWVSVGVSGDARHPAVAYNPVVQQYLVVWQAPTGYYGQMGIYAQRVGTDGSLVGDAVWLSTSESPGGGGGCIEDGVQPDVACSVDEGRWLVVWLSIDGHYGSLMIHGQFVSAAGESTEEWVGFDWEPIQNGHISGQPALAYGTGQRAFVAVWQAYPLGGVDIYGGNHQLPTPPSLKLPLVLKTWGL